MKKVLLSGFVMGVLGATAANADTTTQLTTKGYVDTGLQAVYNKAKGLANDAKTAAQAAQATANEAKTTAGNALDSVTTLQSNLNDLDEYVGSKTANVDGQVVPASGLSADVENLETAVGDKTNLETTNKANLVGAINEIKGSIDTINTAVQNQQVQAGAGVAVSGSTVSVNGLDATTAADTNGIYVFQGNQATKLNVATTWSDPDWLN